ncbi:MAG: methyltransferase [Thermoleophilia bacterium]
MSAAPDPMEMLEAYQRTAVVAAACETGVARALGAGPRTAADVAEDLGLHPRGAQALLGALSALGLVDRTGDAYALSAAGAVLDPAHPETIAGVVAKEWFFYRAWTGLAETVRTGHARMEPWPERLATDPAALPFLAALDDLGRMFGGGLPALADLPYEGRVLDAGGGTGIHAAALAAARPGLEVTVLDLAPVAALVEERHPGIPFLAGDLRAPRFGRPEGETWDAVLLANVLHDWPADAAAAIVAEAAGLLRPGGALVIYEWLLDPGRDTPAPVAMFALMMMVENEGGAAYTEDEVRAWLEAAGLERITTRRDGGPIAVVSAWAP